MTRKPAAVVCSSLVEVSPDVCVVDDGANHAGGDVPEFDVAVTGRPVEDPQGSVLAASVLGHDGTDGQVDCCSGFHRLGLVFVRLVHLGEPEFQTQCLVEGRLSAQNHWGVVGGVLASNRHSFIDPGPRNVICAQVFSCRVSWSGASGAGDAFRDVPGGSAGMCCLAEALRRTGGVVVDVLQGPPSPTSVRMRIDFVLGRGSGRSEGQCRLSGVFQRSKVSACPCQHFAVNPYLPESANAWRSCGGCTGARALVEARTAWLDDQW